ncbi:MAG TPA: zf-HC2 domain-containing protein [Candidatus Nanoarchaeia archaeon]|nr:zf-HC2 domain-containing protein [Candidatus Nanoarchaeia archaeon]
MAKKRPANGDGKPKRTARCVIGEEYEELFKGYLSGTVTRAALTRVERHILGCETCRRTWIIECALEQMGSSGALAVHIETRRQKDDKAAGGAPRRGSKKRM